MTKFLITIDRNVSEGATCEFDDLDKLKEYLKENKLFEEIDRQAREEGDSSWQEICGEIITTYVSELDKDDKIIKEYIVKDNDNSLAELNQYREEE